MSFPFFQSAFQINAYNTDNIRVVFHTCFLSTDRLEQMGVGVGVIGLIFGVIDMT